MDTEHYKTYSAEDFILDKDFRMIFKNPVDQSKLDEFILQFPDRKEELLLAAEIINELKIKTFRQPAERKKELWQKIAGFTGVDHI
jgi:hypothetical protein